MTKVNRHHYSLKRDYIFPIIEQKLFDLKKKAPPDTVLNLGVGDISLPLAPTIAHAIKEAVDEMSQSQCVRGYGPSEGYDFLRQAIAQNVFSSYGIESDEIFISDGANSDIVGLAELFDAKTVVGIPDPSYPVYRESSLMMGRKLVSLPCDIKSGFVPQPPDAHCDLIYFCSPANPTGVALNRDEMRKWVEYAHKERAILIYDNAYAAFITSADVPASIFEIEGAKEVAIELRSFSKSAGFTGLRCGYAVVPKTVTAYIGKKRVPLHPLWLQRQRVKFNGVAYPIQKGAASVFTPQGQRETAAQIGVYLEQGRLLSRGLKEKGFTCYGGKDAPYLWWQVPPPISSWEFFDLLLEKCHLVAIPGSGFGKRGEGYIRLSTFISAQTAQEALRRIDLLQTFISKEV